MLYGAMFLASGAVLLAVTDVLAQHATTIRLPGRKGDAPAGVIHQTTAPPRAFHAGNHTVHLTPAQRRQQQAEITHLHAVAMQHLLVRSGLVLAAMALLSIGLGWLVAGRVLRPVRTLNATARRITASNLHERLSLDGPDDEFRELATTLDDVFRRLQMSFEAQRRFVANASHELRTPLTLDRALLERALRKPEPTHSLWRSTCERLLASSEHQERLLDALLTLARSEGALDSRQRVDLGDLVEEVLLSPELDTRNGTPSIHTYINPAVIGGDPRLLERLVRNLVDNAIRHNVPDGNVEIATATRAGQAVLTVANTGPAVAAADLERLLEPFQRAGADRTAHRNGHGLGLSIVSAIANAHRAGLTLKPRPAGGLLIEVTFAGLGDGPP